MSSTRENTFINTEKGIFYIHDDIDEDSMSREKIKRFQEQQDATCDTLYSVTYIKSAGNYGEICPRRGESSYYITRELTLVNVIGYGIGTVFFVNKDDKLVVLPWSAIISMIPVEEKEISNYAR